MASVSSSNHTRKSSFSCYYNTRTASPRVIAMTKLNEAYLLPFALGRFTFPNLSFPFDINRFIPSNFLLCFYFGNEHYCRSNYSTFCTFLGRTVRINGFKITQQFDSPTEKNLDEERYKR